MRPRFRELDVRSDQFHDIETRLDFVCNAIHLLRKKILSFRVALNGLKKQIRVIPGCFFCLIPPPLSKGRIEEGLSSVPHDNQNISLRSRFASGQRANRATDTLGYTLSLISMLAGKINDEIALVVAP